jgi:myo-inositol 2-dehydrogenase/D-chiro-inositol 1-dehydrogenase
LQINQKDKLNTKELQIGLIGGGAMGLYHAFNLHTRIPAVRIAGFFEPDDSRAKMVQETCAKPERFDDPLELINSNKMDAIVITSPDATHAKFVLACIKIKKPVFCEKPLAVDPDSAVSILNEENAIGKKYLSVGFNRRFDPYHRELKRIQDEGKHGKALLWKGVHRNTEAMYNTQGAFILVNSAGHDVDSARWLLDSDVKSIFVRGLKSRPDLSEDSKDLLTLNMEMENGTLGIAEVFVNAGYAYEVIAELVFQRGTAETSHADKALVRSENVRGVYMSGDFRGYFSEAYLEEMFDWTDSIIQNRPFSGACAWDGYAALCVTLAGVTSLQEGRVVSVQTISKPDLYR